MAPLANSILNGACRRLFRGSFFFLNALNYSYYGQYKMRKYKIPSKISIQNLKKQRSTSRFELMAEFVKIEIVLQYRNMGMREFFFAQLLGTVNVKNFNMKMRE